MDVLRWDILLKNIYYGKTYFSPVTVAAPPLYTTFPIKFRETIFKYVSMLLFSFDVI